MHSRFFLFPPLAKHRVVNQHFHTLTTPPPPPPLSKKEGKLRNSAVIAYELRKQWIKAFGEKHVIAFQNMKPKITEVLTSYKKHVYIPSSQKTDKHTGKS